MRIDKVSTVVSDSPTANTLCFDCGYFLVGDLITSDMKEYYRILDKVMYVVPNVIECFMYILDRPVSSKLGIKFFIYRN